MALEKEKESAKAKPRARWTSRAAFLLASIGSAVGLGNVWRFPWLSYKFGGGVFLIPYLLALVLLGLPMLMVELGVGRTFQKGDVEAFGKIHRRLRGVGFMSVLGSFVIVTYYVSIVSWSLVYFVGSFEDPLPWKGKEGGFEDSRKFLFEEVLHEASEENLDAGKSSIISGYVFAGLVATWISIYFSLVFGVKGVSRVVAITVPLPILLLAVLLVYNSTLEGADDGIEAYIGKWDMGDLGQKSIWPFAAGQIFFSNSIGTGVMTAFGSFTGEESNIVMDTTVIALTNSAVSIFAGFVVYAIIGNVAHEFNLPVEEAAESNGPSLAFITYPTGMLSFDDGVSNLMSAIFFLTLFTLGIDSAFSLVEAFTTALRDMPRFKKTSNVHIISYTCFIGFLISILFASDVGFSLLDAVDRMILSYGLLTMGLLKVVAVSWVFGWEDTVARVGLKSAAVFTYGYGAAVSLALALSAALWDPISDTLYLAVSIPAGFILFLVTTSWAFLQRSDRQMSFSTWVSQVAFAGTEILRNTINEKARQYGNWKLPCVWDFFIKYLNPPILSGLIVNGIFNDATDYEGGFYNYPGWVQAVGIMSVVGLLLVFIVIAIYPSWWTILAGREDHSTVESVIVGDHNTNEHIANGSHQLKAPLTKTQEGSSTELP